MGAHRPEPENGIAIADGSPDVVDPG